MANNAIVNTDPVSTPSTGGSTGVPQGGTPWNTQQYQQLLQNIAANQGWDTNSAKSILDRYQQQFSSTYKNLTGSDPTQDDYNSFWSMLPSSLGQSGFKNTSYSDAGKLITDYIDTNKSSDIQKYQTDQIEKQSQDVINKQTDELTKQLNTEMPDIMAGYNQKGLLNSGAFSKGVADTLAGGASNEAISALSGTVLPSIMSMNPINQNYQSASGQGTANFDLESQLSQQLAKMAQPNTLQQLSSVIGGGLQAGGSIEGGSLAAGGTSAVCLELLKHGLATMEEIDALHWKVLGSMFKRCRALHFYAKNGKKLVKAANDKGLDWNSVKSWFIDYPLHAQTSDEAVIRYSLACKKLASLVAPELWDERIMKPRILDFFIFIIPVLMVPGYRVCYRDLFKRSLINLAEA